MIKIDDDIVREGHRIRVVNQLEFLIGKEVFVLEKTLLVVKIKVEVHKNLKSWRCGPVP